MKKVLFIIALLAVLMPAGLLAEESDTIWVWNDYKNNGYPEDVKFMPDGNSILVPSVAGGIYILDTNGNLINTLPYPAKELDIYPDGSKIVFTDFKTLSVYDFNLNDTIKLLTVDSEWFFIRFVMISKDGKYLITMIGDRRIINNGYIYQIKIYDANTYQEIKNIIAENSIIFYSSDNQNEYFLTVDARWSDVYKNTIGKIDKWTIGSWERIEGFITLSPGEFVSTMAISPDGNYIALGFEREGIVKLYDYKTGQFIKTLNYSEECDFIVTIEFSKNSKYLILSTCPLEKNRSTKIVDFINNIIVKQYYFSLLDIDVFSKYLCGYSGRKDFMASVILLNLPEEVTNVTNTKESDLTLYPNPATDYIDIAVTDNRTLKDAVKVYDVLGNVVLSSPACSAGTPSEGGHIRFDVSDLAAGVYFVRVGGKMYKFVKM